MVSEVASLQASFRPASRSRPVRMGRDAHVVTIHHDPAAVDHWWWEGDARSAGPFRSRTWIEAFFESFSLRDDVEPFLVDVRASGGDFVLGLPLVRRTIGRRRFIEFADLGVADYNLPVLGPAAPTTSDEAAALVAAIERALPEADVLRLGKMPLTIGGHPNPLVRAREIVPETLFGNVIVIDDGYDGWLKSLGGRDRREFARAWRVFTRHPEARLVVAEDTDTARRVMHWIEHRQRARIRDQGLPYDLDAPRMSAFHERLIEQGLESGEVVVSALMAGDEIVAGLFGLANGREYIALRVAFEGTHWASVGPGRLLIERTMAALHARGFHRFDLGVGDYSYKHDFRPAVRELGQLLSPLSLVGSVEVARLRLKAHLRDVPVFAKLVRRLRDRKARLRALLLGGSAWCLMDELSLVLTLPYL